LLRIFGQFFNPTEQYFVERIADYASCESAGGGQSRTFCLRRDRADVTRNKSDRRDTYGNNRANNGNNGVAIFSSLGISKKGSGYTLKATVTSPQFGAVAVSVPSTSNSSARDYNSNQLTTGYICAAMGNPLRRPRAQTSSSEYAQK